LQLSQLLQVLLQPLLVLELGLLAQLLWLLLPAATPIAIATPAAIVRAAPAAVAAVQLLWLRVLAAVVMLLLMVEMLQQLGLPLLVSGLAAAIAANGAAAGTAALGAALCAVSSVDGVPQRLSQPLSTNAPRAHSAGAVVLAPSACCAAPLQL
jgi:small-conductance mechanosensitive channel